MNSINPTQHNDRAQCFNTINRVRRLHSFNCMHPFKRVLLGCACLLLSLFAAGQENTAQSTPGSQSPPAMKFAPATQSSPVTKSTPAAQKRLLTLEAAVARALEHAPEQKIQQMKVQEARLQLKEARLRHIPNIHASGDVRRNLIIPSTPVPAHLFNPEAGEEETMYLKFNTEWNATAGLNLDYDLFNPEKVFSTDERKQQLKIQEYDALISEQETQANVALAYAECVIAMEQLLSLESDTAYYSHLFNRADTLYRREKITLIEKNETRVAYNESIANYLMAEKIANDSKAELLYRMGEEITPESIRLLTLAESLPELLEKMERSFSDNSSTNTLEELRQQEMVGLSELRIKSARLKHAPTLAFIGFLGSNHYNRSFDLFNDKFWRGHSYVGISLKMPITQSLHTANETSRLRLQRQVESENLRDLRNANAKELLSERSLLEVRRENHRLSLQNLELSQQNTRAAEVQFEKGHILQQELLNEQRSLHAARQSYLQSAHDVISSYIALDRMR